MRATLLSCGLDPTRCGRLHEAGIDAEEEKSECERIAADLREAALSLEGRARFVFFSS